VAYDLITDGVLAYSSTLSLSSAAIILLNLKPGK
jgi:hypothetical protein